jgi:hypothetical protein
MIVNNFALILNILNFDSDDDFYFLQIIKRRKENPEMISNSSVIKSYYISSKEYLQTKESEIITICEKSNARACISLNRRSFRKIAFHTLKKISEQICDNDFRGVKNAYDKACGMYMEECNKKWVIDLDSPLDEYSSNINDIILSCEPNEYSESKYISKIPTPNGAHLITKPFNVKTFNSKFKENFPDLEIPDIHKNNPTILYFNKSYGKIDEIIKDKSINYAKFKHEDEYDDPVYNRDVKQTINDFKAGFSSGVNFHGRL